MMMSDSVSREQYLMDLAVLTGFDLKTVQVVANLMRVRDMEDDHEALIDILLEMKENS